MTPEEMVCPACGLNYDNCPHNFDEAIEAAFNAGLEEAAKMIENPRFKYQFPWDGNELKHIASAVRARLSQKGR